MYVCMRKRARLRELSCLAHTCEAGRQPWVLSLKTRSPSFWGGVSHWPACSLGCAHWPGFPSFLAWFWTPDSGPMLLAQRAPYQWSHLPSRFVFHFGLSLLESCAEGKKKTKDFMFQVGMNMVNRILNVGNVVLTISMQIPLSLPFR